jgi:cob(I)alamin adenosyltransferase
MPKKGRIFVFTGNGQGKTTAALGIALRAIAHNKKVVIIQFMKKDEKVGEYISKKFLPQNFEIYQFGRKDFVDLENPSDEDRRIAKKGLDFAKKMLDKKPDILILDEINLASKINLLQEDDVLDLIRSKSQKTTIILTGRYAPKKFIEIADVVTEMKEIKRKNKYDATEGIEF